MCEAVLNGKLCVLFTTRAVHRLQEKVLEVKMLVKLRLGILLREDEFQFMPGAQDQLRVSLRTHTNPINSQWCRPRAVCFDGNFKSFLMKCSDQSLI
jgi:hypothetical protein